MKKLSGVQDVDRCVRCNHERKCSDNLEGKCRYERVIEDIASSVCGCKCAFPSTSVSEAAPELCKHNRSSDEYCFDCVRERHNEDMSDGRFDDDELYARVHQPPEQNLEDKNSFSPKPKAPSHSSVVVSGDSSLDACHDFARLRNAFLMAYDLAGIDAIPLPEALPESAYVPGYMDKVRELREVFALCTEQPSTSDVLGNPNRGISSRNEPESSESKSTLVTVDEAEAERIRIVAYLSYDTTYSDNFCLRCSHDPSNCECHNPVYMDADWTPSDELKALKVALFQEVPTSAYRVGKHPQLCPSCGGSWRHNKGCLDSTAEIIASELSVHQPDVQAADSMLTEAAAFARDNARWWRQIMVVGDSEYHALILSARAQLCDNVAERCALAASPVQPEVSNNERQ